MNTYAHTHTKIIDNLDVLYQILGDDLEVLLKHKCTKILKDKLFIPSPTYIDDILLYSNRSINTIKNISNIFNHGRLKHTGYISILPVDQGIEHNASFSFYKNQDYFDPENIIKLAIEGGCSAVATTFGNFGIIARKYAHKIPFIVKINHSENLTYPNPQKQTIFGTIKDAYNMGACAIGATVYFCNKDSQNQINQIAMAFEEAHNLGMATILWCYPRSNFLKTAKMDYHSSADITGQANYIGATIQADIIKQKLPTVNYGFKNLNFSKYNEKAYEHLIPSHPIDMTRFQVANCMMGKISLINSGGTSTNQSSDLSEVLKTAIINKRAGGSGLISGRKAFQKPLKEGIKLLNAIQNIYLNDKITIA